MAEYDLDGWKVPDLTDPGPLSHHAMRASAGAERAAAAATPQAARASSFAKGGDYPGGFRNPFADK